ncbi:MAG: hypothetical protein JW747_04365 [Candidatus Aminicenantes bacterium]|nr:hypothetical protein [Candidatus Aminicenantes bacterium]
MNRDGFRTCLFLTGSFFIVWPAATLGLSVIGFALGVPLSRWQILSGFVLAAAFLIVGAVKLSPAAAKTVAASSLGLVVVLTPAAAFAAEAFIDTSYDGRAYHQNTLIQMATGWNPVARPLEPDGRSLDYEPLPRSPWTVHFPKSAETTAAAFVKATGRIESGKAFNILLLYSAFALSLYALLGFAGLRLRSALLFASLAALNPVTICTLHSYYVDGQMASLLTGLFALILALWREKGLWPLAVLGPALVLTINTKFPGLGYAFFLSGGLLAGFLILRQGRRLLAAGAVCLLSGIIGFGAVGYNPYITNWKHFGHPLHPAYGPRSFGEEDMKRFLSTPPNLADKNRFEQFFISLTSRSDYVPYPEPTRRKLPFTVTAGEVASFGNTTIRAGGFGPLFGGIVLLLVPFAAVGFFLGGRRSLPHLGFVLLVALTIAVNPQCWWARLTPQAWLLPLIFLFFLSRLKPRRKAVRWGVAVLLVLTVMNLGLVLGSNTVQQTGRTLLLRRKLDRLARADRPILLVTGAFPSTRALLAERGIRFQEVEALPEGLKPHRLADGVLYARPNAPRRHDE